MYPSAFPSKNIASNVQHTIDSITPSFYRAFEEKYAGMFSLNCVIGMFLAITPLIHLILCTDYKCTML